MPTHPTETFIGCNEPAKVGFLTLCTVTVEDVLDGELGSRSSPSGSVSFASNSPGIFKNFQGGQITGCSLEQLSQFRSKCEFSYTPTELVTGTHTLTASYNGSAVHKTSSDDQALHLQHTTAQSMACTPLTQRTKPISCEVVVEDLVTGGGKITPTGTTSLSGGLFPSGPITTEGISTPSCPWTGTGVTGKAVCKFTYTPAPKDAHKEMRFLGSQWFSGTGPHEGSSSSVSFVVPAVVQTTVVCTPGAVTLGTGTTSCAIKVEAPTGESPDPTTVTLEANRAGSFPSGPSCNLPTTTTRSSTCNVVFKPSVSGTIGIKGLYPGGPNDEAGNGTTQISVARETKTKVQCAPADLSPGVPSQCTVTVEDPIGGPPAEALPTGTVAFQSNNTGSFTPPTCLLSGGSCTVSYSPEKTGDHTVTANYQHDPEHLDSSGSTLLIVHRHTTTQVSCLPGKVDTGSLTNCTVLVTDDSPAAVHPSGRVDFFHEGVGNFEGSSFCQLSDAGAANASSCQVIYKPTKIGNGGQTITGFYNGAVGVDPSQGSGQLEVGNPTTTALSCLPNSVAVGTQTTCTVTVADQSAEVRQVTGTVSLTHTSTGQFSGNGECKLKSDGPGNSSCEVAVSYTPGAVGAHQIKASYGGDPSHSASEDTKSVAATPADTATSVSCVPASVIVGQGTQCTAEVTDTLNPANRPSGSVSFLAAGSASGFSSGGSCTLPSSGANKCTLTFTAASVPASGQVPIEGQYGGDGVHKTSAGNFSLAVGAKHPTTSAIACEASTVAVGHLLSCNLTVEDTGGSPIVPSGTLSFEASGESSFPGSGSSCQLGPAGTPTGPSSSKAICAVQYRADGPNPPARTISVSYAGDVAHLASASTANLQVIAEHRTTVLLQCAPPSVEVGVESHCTATVEDILPPGQASVPGGEINFGTEGAGSFSSEECNLEPLANGRSASCEVGFTGSLNGEFDLRAHYRGDQVHGESDDSFTLRVGPKEANETRTKLECEHLSILSGGSTLCSANVTDLGGPKPGSSPTGTVFFADPNLGSFVPAVCQLQAGGAGSSSCQAKVGFSAENVGSHPLIATYGGDDVHLESEGTLGLQVLTEQHGTETSLSCDAAEVDRTESVACTARVTDLTGFAAAPPSGVVSFGDADGGSFTPSTCTLVAADASSSVCEARFSSSALGDHHLSAHYEGETTHAPSDGTATVTVTRKRDRTGIVVACVPASVLVGNGVECRASVADLTSALTLPQGTVRFSSDNASGEFEPAAQCTLSSLGIATCSVIYSPKQLPLSASGKDTIEAEYLGDEDHSTAVSSFSLTVEPEAPPAAPTESQLSCVPATVAVGNASACEVEVSVPGSAGEQPRGRVSFSSDNPAGGFIFDSHCDLPSQGRSVCSVLYIPNQRAASGEDTIEARYLGDAGHKSSADSARVLVEPRGPSVDQTSTSVECHPTTVIVGNATECTAHLADTTDPGSRPTGAVHFAPEDPNIAFPNGSTCTLPEAGPADCSVVLLLIGSPDAEEVGTEAQYLGDATHAQSSQVFGVFVQPAPDPTADTTAALQCNPSALSVGELTECTATVANAGDGAERPSGGISFHSDSAAGRFPGGASCSLPADGLLRCTVLYRPNQAPASGKSTIEARYLGDGTHHGAVGTFELSVSQTTIDPTRAELECVPSSVQVGSRSTCTARVTDTAATPLSPPTGTVRFTSSDAGSAFSASECELTGSGNERICFVEYTPAPGSAGAHQIRAHYAPGDADHSASDAEPFALTVTPAAPDPTATTLACLPASIEVGRKTTCTATVADTAATPQSAPTGTVSFSSSNGGSTFTATECELTGTGTRSCSVQYTPAPGSDGLHQIGAHYAPADAQHEPSDADPFALTVTPATGVIFNDTTTALACVPASVAVGAETICTATVTDVAPVNRFEPLGAVHFSSDNSESTFDSKTCELGNGNGVDTATCQVHYTPAPGSVGAHQIRAHYEPGDEQHEVSDAAPFALTVTPAAVVINATTTTLACVPASVAVGVQTTCTATVTDVADLDRAVPQGTVQLDSDNPTSTFDSKTCQLGNGNGTDTASCQVHYTPAPGSAGPHQISAHFEPGDEQHDGSDAQPFALTVTAAAPAPDPTATVVQCVPASVEVTKKSTCTATVTDTATPPQSPPTGKVRFTSSDGGSVFSATECELTGTGARTCAVEYTPAAGSAGTHQIGAHYTPADPQHEASDAAPFALTVSAAVPPKDATSTLVECAPASLEAGRKTTCTATVTDAASTPLSPPTGKVRFTSSDAGSAFSATECEIVGGFAQRTCSVEYAPAIGSQGVHQVSGQYLPADVQHDGSAAPPFDLTVTPVTVIPGDTATTLVCAPAALEVGQQTTCTATVTDVSLANRSEPGGTVHFDTDSAGSAFDPETCQLGNGNGADSASCQVNYTAAALPATGNHHTLDASYDAGDGSHNDSTSAAFPLIVTPVGTTTDPTVTTLSCAPASVEVGRPSHCTATVTDTASTPRSAPTGKVRFTSSDAGSSFSAVECELEGGLAQRTCVTDYTPAPGSAGNHQVRAHYAPADDEHDASDSQAFPITVTPGQQTTTALTCDPASLLIGASTKCTATVSRNDGAAAPTGGVVFVSNSSGSFDAGGCLLVADGATASCHVTYTPTVLGAPHAITARYSGGASLEPSQAQVQIQVSEPIHATSAAVSCAPTPILIAAATTCTATVTDGSARASTPGGSVKFATDGPGGFSAGAACSLAAAGAGKASCSVTYTPAALGSGVHKVTASYQGEAAHSASQAAAQVEVLAAPETKFAKRPKLPRRKSLRRKVKFRFASDQAGVSFECKLDKKAFRACRNPFKAKLRPGRHVFQVRAVSSRGVADPTPAIYRWRVMGKKR